MIYIIADDLTGANDTGVQFAKKGYNTMVSILDEQSTIIIPNNLDVFVMDTETRELESKTAREKLRSILKKININKENVVYKKVDSTLRGNKRALTAPCASTGNIIHVDLFIKEY